jgi:hypothetical protein
MASVDILPASTPTAPVLVTGPAKHAIPRGTAAQRAGFSKMGASKTTHTSAAAVTVMVASGGYLPKLTSTGKRMYVGDVSTKPDSAMSNFSGSVKCVDGTLTAMCTKHTVETEQGKEFNRGKVMVSAMKPGDLTGRVYTPEDLISVMCFDNRSDKPTHAFSHGTLFGANIKERLDAKSGDVVLGMNGESLVLQHRMTWEELIAHPIFTNNANGQNTCILVDSSAENMPPNQLLREMECRDSYKTKKDGVEVENCLWEFFVVTLDADSVGNLERVALKFTAWDSDVSATFNITDASMWHTIRNVLMSHEKFEMAVASNLNFKEPETNAMSVFLGVDQTASDEVKAIPSRNTAENRRVTGVAINWAPLLPSFFSAKVQVALALLGEDADPDVIRGCFPSTVTNKDLNNLNRDYTRPVSTSTCMDTDRMQLAKLDENSFLYGTCHGSELAALLNIHPETEFEQQLYIVPACTMFKTAIPEKKTHFISRGGVVDAKGDVEISASELYASGMASHETALVDFRPVASQQGPVYVLACFTRRAITSGATPTPPSTDESGSKRAKTTKGKAGKALAQAD